MILSVRSCGFRRFDYLERVVFFSTFLIDRLFTARVDYFVGRDFGIVPRGLEIVKLEMNGCLGCVDGGWQCSAGSAGPIERGSTAYGNVSGTEDA